jgi:amino acid adenylation domain-containing protein
MTADHDNLFDLTATQEAMLLYSIYAPKSAAYFEQFCYAYRGALDVEAFKAAWQRVVNRHSMLRTSFRWSEQAGPRQVVHDRVDVPFAFEDWRDLAEHEQRLTEFLEADCAQGFDVSVAPLIRVAVLQTGSDSFYIVISNHHLVLDGWSLGVVRREVTQVYQASIARQEIELPPPPAFSTYVDWLGNKFSKDAKDFWRGALGDSNAPEPLPIDRAPGMLPGADEQFGELALDVPEELSNRLQTAARKHRVTMSTIAQGAWAILLSRYCRSNDVLFGITVSGRPYDFEEVDSLVGLLINTLPLRVRMPADTNIGTCLQELQKHVSRMREHETTSLKQIHEWSDLPNNRPLFETLVVFENFIGHDLQLNLGGDIRLTRSHLARTNYPLVLVVNPHAELGVRVIYHQSRFAADAIERLLNHLVTIMESLANDLEQPFASVNVLSEHEKRMLLDEWSETAPAGADLKPVYLSIEEQAATTPNAVAVAYDGQSLTYAELNARANQLARFLRSQAPPRQRGGGGVGLSRALTSPLTPLRERRGEVAALTSNSLNASSADSSTPLVGICLERSIDMIVAVLAVQKAGTAYVPLDPAYPTERLSLMLEDSGVSVVLTRQSLSERLPAFNGRAIALDVEADGIALQSVENLELDVALSDLAYVMYTSGSTGTPKGVMIEHRALANFVNSASAHYEVNADDRVLQFASLSFDTSAEEIYCALACGATLVLRADSMITSPKQFLESCGELGITVLDLPTGYWHHMVNAIVADDLQVPGSIRIVILGGEQAHADHVTKWLARAGRNARLVNTYGPTEATVVTTTCDLTEYRDGAAVAIGRPIAGASVYVLDDALQPSPVGIPGELYIGGAGVARGYLNRPDLTAQRFIVNPFADGRLYRSGDLVRYQPDGNLEFLGRADNQVKIRGFRIELEEIEEAIRSYHSVTDAVVKVIEDSDGDKRLCAYVVFDGQSASDINDLRSFLKGKLPLHMVPGIFTMLDSLPLTANGKVDRRALPDPNPAQQSAEGFVGPRTPTEELVAAAWCQALKLPRVSMNDNFFELGGHSLLAAKVFAELQRSVTVELNFVDIFNAPTVAGLANLIYEREAQCQDGDELTSLLAELDGLSDEEAHQLLATETVSAPAH